MPVCKLLGDPEIKGGGGGRGFLTLFPPWPGSQSPLDLFAGSPIDCLQLFLI